MKFGITKVSASIKLIVKFHYDCVTNAVDIGIICHLFAEYAIVRTCQCYYSYYRVAPQLGALDCGISLGSFSFIFQSRHASSPCAPACEIEELSKLKLEIKNFTRTSLRS